jgi:hypothetical protein
MHEMQAGLGGSPELFPHALNVRDDTVAFIRLDRAAYENASFLDARILTPDRESRSMPWLQVAAAVDAARLAEACGYIFHIGHVGSTLLSRLVGAHRSAFVLREPAILRTFAQLREEPDIGARAWHDAEFEERLSGCLKLLSRTFEPKQLAVIKATSFVSEIAAEILSRPAAPKAMMMYVSPESYIATILGGPNSRQEARVLAPSRLRRLQRRIGSDAWQQPPANEGEALALGWACETSALAQAAVAGGTRVLRLDFDRFLADPPLLLQVLHHFGIDAAASDVQAILRGPHLHRYSKAPEHAYDATLRRDVLNEARALHGDEIRRGLAWLDRAASQFAVVRQALAFTA